MVTVKPDYYDDFRCLMGECPSSCCTLWQIDVDEKAYEYYQKLDTPYGEYIRSQIDDIGDEHWIKVYNGRCAFLNDENLCDMHCQIGPKHMAFTCRQYPDFTIACDTYEVTGRTLSCPYVANRIVREKSKTKLIVEGKSNDEYENEIFHIVNKCIEIAQDDSIKYRDREKAIIDYIRKEQMYLVEKFKVAEIFMTEDNKTIWDYCDTLNSLNVVTEKWPKILSQLEELEYSENDIVKFEEYLGDREKEYENILVYFLYKHIMYGTNDGNVFQRVRFAIIATRIIFMVGLMKYIENEEFTTEDNIKVAYIFSKEIEHDDENIDTILEDISLGMI